MLHRHRILEGLVPLALLIGWGAVAQAAKAEPPAVFVRGWNLNGPSVEIDSRRWEGRDSPTCESSDSAFENQAVPLVPPTDAARALMIRSSRWNSHVKIVFKEIPPGDCQVGVYLWEDNNSERVSLSLQGKQVADIASGAAGEWRRLGPYPVRVGKDGRITLTSSGGAANLSGVEVWSGRGPVPAVGESAAIVRAPISPEAAAFFHQQAAPLLSRACLECHNASEPRGGLDLSTETAAMKGGESGPAIVPGKPEESLLWEYVRSDEMPQKRTPLSPAEKKVLQQWIGMGAPWAEPRIDPFLASTERRAGYDWWSLQALHRPERPRSTTAIAARNEIDSWIVDKLAEQGLSPAPEADRRTLIRRATFDLTGLPPAPEEIEAFLSDPAPDAYERLVDRLLASPHYGERWARHWLDVIRFGESQGYERNRIRDNAWRYRDWVIEAFNRNLPYDEFVRDQIAGDVLHPQDLSALIATGYHVIGTWDQVAHLEGSREMQKSARQDHIEDLVAALGQAYLGLTVQCARCHDHKFDPISQQDYYRLAALLGGVAQQEKERAGIDLPAHSDRLAERDFSGSAHAPTFQPPPATFVLARGDVRQPREIALPEGLAVLAASGLPQDLGLSSDAADADRRRELADWLTDRRNPLTARVFVNRVWHYHFGRGLVETPSDFGFNGGRPSHPQMLDALAWRFMESGWDVKDLQRIIMTSATYRQQSQAENSHAETSDAENRLLWRANRRRLEGEELRDAVLWAGGSLNDRLGGASFRDVHVDLKQNHEFTVPTGEFNAETCRRAIYRLWARSGNHPLLECMDCPDPTVAAPQRTQTITPLQALSLLNSPLMEQAAQRCAERLAQGSGDASEQARGAYRLLFGRDPAPRELELTTAFIKKYSLSQLCLTLFNSNEFLYVD